MSYIDSIPAGHFASWWVVLGIGAVVFVLWALSKPYYGDKWWKNDADKDS